jgi:hypothetical protein
MRAFLLPIMLTLACLLTDPAQALAQEEALSLSAPPPSPGTGAPGSPSPIGTPPLPEKEPPLWDIPGRINAWFSRLVASALEPVFGFLSRSVFSTPDLPAHARISELWRFSLGIAGASLVLFVLVGAGVVMVEGGLGARLTAKEFLPRILVAAGAANLSLFLVEQMISVSNALAQAFLSGQGDPAVIAARVADRLVASLSNPFLVLFGIVVVVLGLLVLASFVLRVAALVVLATGAPLMLVTHALPQTESVARIWWRATAALLVTPVVQSMLLAATLGVFLGGEEIFGVPAGDSGAGEPNVIDLLVIACLLYLLAKVPFWALKVISGHGPSYAWSRAKYYVLARAVRT